MFKFIIFFLNAVFVLSQLTGTVRNINLVDPTSYVLKFIEETLKQMEDVEWCNLKIPEFKENLDETIFDWHVTGEVTYKNGFLVSLQHVDVYQHTVQQVWSWNNTDSTASVNVRGTLRMLDVAIGFDVSVALPEETVHHTGKIVFDSVEFTFTAIKNVMTDEMRATVIMNRLEIYDNKMIYVPSNNLTHVLSSTFRPTTLSDSIAAWGPNMLQPLLLDVIKNKVEFPEICYNCAV